MYRVLAIVVKILLVALKIVKWTATNDRAPIKAMPKWPLYESSGRRNWALLSATSPLLRESPELRNGRSRYRTGRKNSAEDSMMRCHVALDRRRCRWSVHVTTPIDDPWSTLTATHLPLAASDGGNDFNNRHSARFGFVVSSQESSSLLGLKKFSTKYNSIVSHTTQAQSHLGF